MEFIAPSSEGQEVPDPDLADTGSGEGFLLPCSHLRTVSSHGGEKVLVSLHLTRAGVLPNQSSILLASLNNNPIPQRVRASTYELGGHMNIRTYEHSYVQFNI